MSDRTAQARDAYWNTHPHTNGPALDMDALRFGVEWADANPKPHTITRARMDETAAKVSERFGGIQSPGALRILFAVALTDLGIEVEDDE